MAFQSSDGRKFTNAIAHKSHQASLDARKQQPEGVGEEDPAAEHGPAHEIHIQHDHEAGMHHVQSIHQDGYEHHSDHGSADEAHEAAKKYAGGEHSEEAIEGLKKFAEEEGEE